MTNSQKEIAADRIRDRAIARLNELEAEENRIIAAALSASHSIGWPIWQRHALLIGLEEQVRDIHGSERFAQMEVLEDGGRAQAHAAHTTHSLARKTAR